MDNWMILREDLNYPPNEFFSSTCEVTKRKKRNYGCFKYFRQNLPPLLKALTTSNHDRGGGGGYQKMSSGICCSKLLLNDKEKKGRPNKIILYAEESWAQGAANLFWIVKPSFWRQNDCSIEEYSGYRKNTGKGQIVFCNGDRMVIEGSFKSSQSHVPDFKLSLSTNVRQTEYNMGYSMTGTLERGWSQLNKYETTHYAVVKKHWPESSFNSKAGFKLL